ncbi:H-NS histone family protein [Roseobacter sp. CCS2]|uniref:H-NS histone family protein n=1 Tax=Roseobacter sp. CCS2 TaxID=391593 RepID=UPI0000F3E081|nr:H-NS histone family protein [Roseobacter sp. CCS2]EBA12266.1 Histone-like protein of HNS family [Roseobacter sp. CCS2]
MKPDLKSMTRKELEKLKANVEKALVKMAEKDKKSALIAAEKAAASHGFSLAELTGDATAKPARKRKAGPKTVSVPKYKNPANSDQTWTGKGRQPDWFKAAIKAGTSPDAMEI